MPTDFGLRLRQARERRGLSLRQIATVTKINLSFLEGIESNDPSKLPGGIFSRSFVKAYAQEVGLDPEATVREFLATFEQDVVPPPAVVVQADASGDGASRLVWPTLAVAVLLLAAIAAFRFFGWPGILSGDPASVAAPAAASPLPVPPSPVAVPALSLDKETEPTAALDAPAGEAVEPPPGMEPVPAGAVAAPLVDDGLMRLSFRPQGGPCWVEVLVDGKMELSREISAGETETRAARDTFDIKVGDAGNCTYTLNDQPGRPLGPAGKVVRVRIDRQSLAQFVQGS